MLAVEGLRKIGKMIFMKRLLISLTSGLFVLLTLNLEGSKMVRAESLLKSCRNYPYDLGINLRQMRSGSFQLLSTSIVNIKTGNSSFVPRALREATLRAKLNISNFLQLTNGSSNKEMRNIDFPIRINGRIIRTNNQLKNKLKKGLNQSSLSLKGVIQIARCNNSSDYVMVTLEVTEKTIRAADYMGRTETDR